MIQAPPLGGDAPLVVVAGPCALEDRDTTLRAAEIVVEAAAHAGLPVVFKASVDKANRTHKDAFRGIGWEAGLAVLAEVRQRFQVPVLTDVHEPWQCDPAAVVADVLQVPAFLCRQTDLLVAAGATGKPVNLKRGQFLDPRQMGYAVQKVGGPAWVTERGTAFGHGDLVFDPRSLVWLAQTGAPVLYDVTHSVQVPGGGQVTGGRRDLALPLARAAVAVGVAGLYAEVHPDPARAKSDAATQLDPATFKALLTQAKAIDAARRSQAPV
ncbi:MAG: 3-deoxy-8-phosphooctulonate synthase [Myxococcales bacterium]|nr:3-deoxy-8-phosphooctulonate synthase [Myxococcales bacterium]